MYTNYNKEEAKKMAEEAEEADKKVKEDMARYQDVTFEEMQLLLRCSTKEMAYLFGVNDSTFNRWKRGEGTPESAKQLLFLMATLYYLNGNLLASWTYVSKGISIPR